MLAAPNLLGLRCLINYFVMAVLITSVSRFWYSRQHIVVREGLSDCITSGHRQQVHWTEKCMLNRQNHNGNHMTANEAPSNIIISFVKCTISLYWRHNGHNCVSNHQPHDCLLNRLFRQRSKKSSKLRVTGLCAGSSSGSVNSPHKWPVTRKMFPFDDAIMLYLFWYQYEI